MDRPTRWCLLTVYLLYYRKAPSRRAMWPAPPAPFVVLEPCEGVPVLLIAWCLLSLGRDAGIPAGVGDQQNLLAGTALSPPCQRVPCSPLPVRCTARHWPDNNNNDCIAAAAAALFTARMKHRASEPGMTRCMLPYRHSGLTGLPLVLVSCHAKTARCSGHAPWAHPHSRPRRYRSSPKASRNRNRWANILHHPPPPPSALLSVDSRRGTRFL